MANQLYHKSGNADEFEASVGGTHDHFTIAHENHPYYIYRRDGQSGDVCYELFRAKFIPAGHKMPDGSATTEDRWTYPGSSQWGKTAWSVNTLEGAIEMLSTYIAKCMVREEKKAAKGQE